MPFPPIAPPQPQAQRGSSPAGATAARDVPGRPGGPRRAAGAPACAPRRPSPPGGAGERKKRPPEQPEAPLSRSWPSATVKRQVARRPAGPPALRAPAQGPPRPATCAPPAPGAAVRFSLSLPPEAVLVIQRRHLEKQGLARPRWPGPAPAADPARPPAACPRARAAAPPGGDLRALLKISLLNERHRYDDVEYEDEAEALDEGLVRRCTEWLRGVEKAAAPRERRERRGAPPHLGTL